MRARFGGKIENLHYFSSFLVAFNCYGMNCHSQDTELTQRINAFVIEETVFPIDGYEKEYVLVVVKKTLAEMNLKTTELDEKDGPVLSFVNRTDWLFPVYSPSGSYHFSYAYENYYYLVNQIKTDGGALEIILGKKELGSSDAVGRKILHRFIEKLKINLGK
jgi:hypothetical protein